MKSIILLGIVALMVSQVVSQPTTLTYFTEHEVEQDEDYIEIGITVHCEDSVLKQAVKTANGIVDKLEKIVMSHCTSQSKKKSECEEVFEASKHNIEPKYQMVRKVETFMAFIVKHEVTIKVRKFEGLGKMTDQLLQAGYGLITIDSFEWKSENEENPEREALKAGVSDGQEICQRMGLKLSRIVSATEVDDKDEVDQGQGDDEEQGGQQEEEEEEPAQVIVFKFEVECS